MTQPVHLAVQAGKLFVPAAELLRDRKFDTSGDRILYRKADQSLGSDFFGGAGLRQYLSEHPYRVSGTGVVRGLHGTVSLGDGEQDPSGPRRKRSSPHPVPWQHRPGGDAELPFPLLIDDPACFRGAGELDAAGT
jgi:hypothetical protein